MKFQKLLVLSVCMFLMCFTAFAGEMGTDLKVLTPAYKTSVQGNTEVSVYVPYDLRAKKLEIYANKTLILEQKDPQENVSFNWDSSQVSNGTVWLKCIAYQQRDQEVIVKHKIYVNNKAVTENPQVQVIKEYKIPQGVHEKIDSLKVRMQQMIVELDELKKELK